MNDTNQYVINFSHGKFLPKGGMQWAQSVPLSGARRFETKEEAERYLRRVRNGVMELMFNARVELALGE